MHIAAVEMMMAIKHCSTLEVVVLYRVYMCKQWQELKVFNDHTALATGVCFGQNAAFIASASMDRSLKVFSTE